jgi:hypothetical protein
MITVTKLIHHSKGWVGIQAFYDKDYGTPEYMVFNSASAVEGKLSHGYDVSKTHEENVVHLARHYVCCILFDLVWSSALFLSAT